MQGEKKEKKDLISLVSLMILIVTTLGSTIYNYSTVNSKVEHINNELSDRKVYISKYGELDKEVGLIKSEVSRNGSDLINNEIKIIQISDRINGMQQQSATISVIVEALNDTLHKVNGTLEKLNNTVIIVNSDLKSLQEDVKELKEEKSNDRK